MAAPFTVLIMAAGHGTRMRSTLPKVLHPICGRPMVEWVIESARGAGASHVVCVTRPGDGVAGNLPKGVQLVEQQDGEGTGAAVLAAAEHLGGDGPLVILSGDHPLVSEELIAQLVQAHCREKNAATVLTTAELDPAGYGRIVRSPVDGSVERIVETKHSEGLAADLLAIREVNIGGYAFDADELRSALDEVPLDSGERYLTGVIPVLRSRGRQVGAHMTTDTLSAHGVNSRVDLMETARLAQRRILERHAAAGVTFVSPESTSVDVGVEIGQDTTVGPGVTLKGSTRIGSACDVGPQTTMLDATVGDGVSVPHSYLRECEVRDGASIGPFAHLRPGARIGENAKVGTFVEVKGSDIGRGAKIPHLSYVGDADVGDGSNLGAGTITANYDGRKKHRTRVGERVRTGVHTSLVAPVDIGDGAYTGAGSTIVEDVPEGALGIARPHQRNVEGYAERVEKEPDR